MLYFYNQIPILLGNVVQSVKDAAYMARGVGLRVKIPNEIPAVTVNRLCGSGFESIIEAARVKPN